MATTASRTIAPRDSREVGVVLESSNVQRAGDLLLETMPPPNENEYWDPRENLVYQISTKEPYVLNPAGDVRVAVLDFGAKANILRALVRRGAVVTVLPWDYDFKVPELEDVCETSQKLSAHPWDRISQTR